MATHLEELIFRGQNGGQRILSAAEAVKAARAIEQEQDRRDLWPFPWVYPPPGSKRRNPANFIAVPAVDPATPVLVLQYKVPTGMQFDLTEVMFCAITTGSLPIGNPGQFLFTVNRNTPASGTAPQGSPLADLQNVPWNFGTPNQGGMKLSRSELFAPTDIISLYVTNVSFGGVGEPNYIVGRFAGWERKV